MIYLILSILSSLIIFWVFRHSSDKSISPISIICVNYIIASILGIILISFSEKEVLFFQFNISLIVFATIIGLGFVGMFLLIQFSTKVKGISVTSIATKLSVVIPIIVSIVIDPNDFITLRKVVGVCVALLAVGLIILNNTKKQTKGSSFFILILPLMLFLGMGAIDSLVKISQQFYLKEMTESIFTTFVFVIATMVGLITIYWSGKQKELVSKISIYYGLILGIANYGSLFFLLKALNLNKNTIQFLDSSRIFMVNNIGIVFLSTIMGIVLFKEKTSYNIFAGLLLSIVAFCLLT